MKKENDEKENDNEVLSPHKRAPEEAIKNDTSPSRKPKTAESDSYMYRPKISTIICKIYFYKS